MILHENRLPADDSHEISCLICYYLKNAQNLKLSSAANYSGALRVNGIWLDKYWDFTYTAHTGKLSTRIIHTLVLCTFVRIRVLYNNPGQTIR